MVAGWQLSLQSNQTEYPREEEASFPVVSDRSPVIVSHWPVLSIGSDFRLWPGRGGDTQTSRPGPQVGCTWTQALGWGRMLSRRKDDAWMMVGVRPGSPALGRSPVSLAKPWRWENKSLWPEMATSSAAGSLVTLADLHSDGALESALPVSLAL